MNPNSKFTPKTPRREKTTLSSNSDSSGGRQKDPVQVFCRLRPMKDDRDTTCIKLLSPTVLTMSSPSESKIMRKDISYVFKHIFTSHSSQKEVFDHVALPLLQDLLRGKNGLLFTYGVTGSGKTYTLTGDHNNPGIMPRCIDTLFNTISDFQALKYVIKSDKMNGFEVQTEGDALGDRLLEAKSSIKTLKRKGSADKVFYKNEGMKVQDINENSFYSVFVSYTEIYNNTVYDLLDESSGKVLQGKILREDSHKNMYVNGITEVEVKSSAEAFELFNIGQRRKRMAHTLLNSESSRSHSTFNIRVVQIEQVAHNGDGQPTVPDRNLLRIGQLSLVDLAGSERCSRTQNTGVRLKEASSINNSLMSLRTCLEILRENQLMGGNRIVPYRDSRLTLLFKNYFEGEGRVQMIVCVNPSVQDYEENLQVLKFAEMTQDVKVTRPESRYTPYRKTPKPTRSQLTPATVKAKPTTGSFSLGPKIPVFKLNYENIDGCATNIQRVMKILRMRKQKSKPVSKEAVQKERHFRKRLVEINQENIVSKSELRSMKALFKKETYKTHNLEAKMVDLETVNDSLATKNEELQEAIRSLHNTVNEKDLKLNQNLLERQKAKQKIALQAEKMTQELDAKLCRQREHLHAEMKAKETKLQRVRQILDTEMVVNAVEMELETDLVQEYEPQATPEHTRDSAHRRHVVNTARQRRSRSAGEVWLEHNAIKPVPLGTVMQPTMNKRKSVSKLSKAADVTNTKQSKYCLIAQEAADDGELETKVYKGDIVPTCGGGAQVIFNDVERLRQESPTGTRS